MNELKYIIYQITNLLNQMIYIGKHSTTTPFDMKKYWGSNEWLKSSIEIHGNQNFKRETLFVFDTENEAYAKEAEIVDKDFVKREDTYNLVVGGEGYPSGENHPMFGKRGKGTSQWGKKLSEERKKLQGENSQNWWDSPEGKQRKELISGENNPMSNKNRTEEQKQNQKERMSGENSPMFGKPRTEEWRKEHSIMMSGPNNPWKGKHHTEVTKKKMSKAATGKHPSEETKKKLSLPPEIIKQRREDIKNEHKTYGYRKRLSVKWNLELSSACQFIKKYASDLIISQDTIINQRREDIKNIPKERGYQAILAEKWGVCFQTVSWFIKNHASDLV